MTTGESGLAVQLGGRSYRIEVARGLAARLAERIERERSEGRGAAVITDASVAEAQQQFLREAFRGLPILEVPAGEPSKRFSELERACSFLAGTGVDRSGCIYAFGGGVVGDLAGYAAASWLRGVALVQVPTTLLAMVDSSVGGKTGINIPEGKNLVGAFHQPEAVYADPDTLRSLPQREFHAGMAEVIKHGLLGDADLFAQLEKGPVLHADSPGLTEVIRRNCAIKAAVVESDEREQSAAGGRALLNLGHTFGHAIEAVAGYGDYLHGEAVAIGLILAARLSEEHRYVAADTADRVRAVLRRYQLPTALREPLPLKDLVQASARDKKAYRGRLRYVVVQDVGSAALDDDVPPELIRRLWIEAGAKED